MYTNMINSLDESGCDYSVFHFVTFPANNGINHFSSLHPPQKTNTLLLSLNGFLFSLETGMKMNMFALFGTKCSKEQHLRKLDLKAGMEKITCLWTK